MDKPQIYSIMNNCEHSILYRNEELEHCCPPHFYFKYFLTTFVSIPKQYTLVLPFFFFNILYVTELHVMYHFQSVLLALVHVFSLLIVMFISKYSVVSHFVNVHNLTSLVLWTFRLWLVFSA